MNHPHKNIFPDEFNKKPKQTPEIFVQWSQQSMRWKLMQQPEKRNFLTGQLQ
jgi:hypothetical protein